MVTGLVWKKTIKMKKFFVWKIHFFYVQNIFVELVSIFFASLNILHKRSHKNLLKSCSWLWNESNVYCARGIDPIHLMVHQELRALGANSQCYLTTLDDFFLKFTVIWLKSMPKSPLLHNSSLNVLSI